MVRVRSNSAFACANAVSAEINPRAARETAEVARIPKASNGTPAIRIKNNGAMRYPASATPEENRRDAEGKSLMPSDPEERAVVPND